ncbi:hypothetical protein M885DRAFT_519132 [Pelagophyceae sp. CCMP2097]|nr:hypothetical protein M885DRAFT_519026 [Pelagophyceae sp. CCMP2097]KAJ1455800.1 hypothetical protein M885DRAFT_519132 [Pelagophyceae sp. CCMP2097]
MLCWDGSGSLTIDVFADLEHVGRATLPLGFLTEETDAETESPRAPADAAAAADAEVAAQSSDGSPRQEAHQKWLALRDRDKALEFRRAPVTEAAQKSLRRALRGSIAFPQHPGRRHRDAQGAIKIEVVFQRLEH